MVVTAAVTLEQDAPWLLRPYDADIDDGFMGLVAVSYTRSRAGQRAGASRAGRPPRKMPDGSSEVLASDMVMKQKAFMAAHRPIWEWLLEHADVQLAVDRDAQHLVWAWLITSGDVVHAVGCKRTLVEAGLAQEVVRDLLGDRLRKHQVCSLELPQMATFSNKTEAIGIDRPREWSMDPTWLVTRMVGR